MGTLGRDVVHALRTLRRAPGFALVAVLTLALGIGAGTAVFTVADAVLVRPLPLPDSDRLVILWSRSEDAPRGWLAYPEVAELREGMSVLEGAGALRDWSFNVTGDGEPEHATALGVSHDLLALLGVPPLLGRSFLPEDDRPGAPPVVLVGHGLWQRRFGGDPGVIGRELTLDGVVHTIVGVLPPGFRLLAPSSVFPEDAELFVPLEPLLRAPHLRAPDVRHLHALGRLRADATTAALGHELAAVAASLRAAHPQAYAGPAQRLVAVPYHEQIVGETRPAIRVLLGAALLLLLLVCANLANLLLARGAARERELALRAVLGASRARLVRQLFAESLLVALAGAAGGVLIAVAGVELLRAFAPSGMPRLDEVAVDGRALAAALLLAPATALIFGTLPAWRAAARAGAGSLAEGTRAVAGGARTARTRRLLVIGQVALAVVLLTGTGLMLRSLLALQRTATGFDAASVLTARISLPAARYDDPASRREFLDESLSRVATLPGVSAAGAVTQLPLSGAQLGSGFAAEGAADIGTTAADLRGVTPDYFRAMGIALLRGRPFGAGDTPDAPRVAIVDETLAARLWPGEEAVGKRLFWQRAPNDPLEVVGVVGAVKHQGLAVAPSETVYRPYTQYAGMTTLYLAVRASGDPLAVAGALRAEVQRIDPELPLADLRPMEARVRAALGEPRFHTTLLGIFAAVALLLAALGIYGLIAYGVARRTRELGIRVALGAQRGDVLSLVVAEGAALAFLGTLAGGAGALALAGALRSLLFGVSPSDPLTFAAVAALLAAVALLATWLPARRAARVDPVDALRAE